MLTDKIHVPQTGDSPTPEDILSSSLGVIFPDDITNQHGDHLTPINYASPAFGPLTLTLADPQGGEHRRLFSHFLWNSSVLLAELMEEGNADEWGLRGEDVLEVGAGTGLSGIMACLMGATRCVVSDYPAPEVLENIRVNVRRNILEREANKDVVVGDICVQGHEWGVLDESAGALDGGFAKREKGTFGRILVADCLWMPWQHENLRRSIAWFLKGAEGRAWVVAGFHTGREKMRGFFEEEALRKDGLETVRIWERNAEGEEREWVPDRGHEDVTTRKRWLVVAVLKKCSG
ncbi:putative NNT1 putative nicotinamide N-methyltransferase [Venustampulla echinocandica]|uniref:Putative NNT1 putative nicotinamide N-methyltransferase n=1 Tax=Venustampulla echinocandica TaxID=2656787 RepID=A0A370TYF4_9HELO|nr:putative NNT1 putative nicotinamide N-methyltransferase [Venustampulla echinocandica]RDL40538.1 putative NNT1 putative nicotinamide N-methyltransferase [Venustampulla echinocandica]